MINALALIAGVEVLLLVINIVLIMKNEAILQRIRGCNEAFALAMALASQGRYSEAREAARRWADRMRAHMAGAAYTRPAPPPHPSQDERRSRFAP